MIQINNYNNDGGVTEYKNFAETYEDLAITLLRDPSYVTSPRGQTINEILDAHIKIMDPTQNLFKNPARDLPLDYLKSELKLYFSGENSAEEFSKASKFWGNIADNGKVNSAYGYLIFKKKNQFGKSQWEWMIDSLKKDKDSRQALMFLACPDFQYDGNKDFVCTISYHMFIRNNKLNMIATRRSQDLFFGMTYDIPWECILMQCALRELTQTYPELTLGYYSLNCGSLHIYERNFEILNNMCKFVDNFKSASTPPINEVPILKSLDYFNNYNGNDEFLTWLRK